MRFPIAALFVAAALCPSSAQALELNEMLRKSPVITINRSPSGVYESVTVVSLVNAPFDLVWQAVLDIDAYATYMNRVEEARVISRSADGREITARFEIDVPLSNTKYTLSFRPDRDKKIIDVVQIKGDLRGSTWRWRFEPRDNVTTVVYSGRMVNFSSIMESMDDDENTISIGITISALLTTVKSIRQHSEALFLRQAAEARAAAKSMAPVPVPAAAPSPSPAPAR